MKIVHYIKLIFLISILIPAFHSNCLAQHDDIKDNEVFSKREKKRLVGVPPEFGNDRDAVMICVLQGRKSFDKYLRKNMRENYAGRKIFISRDKLDLELYSDLKKYPYIFDVNQTSHQTRSFNKNIAGDNKWQTSSTRSYNFSILDRSSGQLYEYPASSGAFGKLIKSYASLLNKVRKIRLKQNR